MKTYGICKDGYLLFETTQDDVLAPPSFPDTTTVDMEESAGMPPQPGMAYHVQSSSWVDVRTLEDLRHARWAAIKGARDAAEFGVFTWDGSVFDADAKSQARLQNALSLASSLEGYSVEWTLADNTNRHLNAAQVLLVGAALGRHVADCHAKARALRAQIVSATAEELPSIHW